MAKKMRNQEGKIFCSNCAETVEEEADNCSECDEFFEDGPIDVKICPTCGCPLESDDEHEEFKEKILKEEIEIEEVQWILTVLDKLLEDLPEEKVEEFAESENFELYERVLDAFDV